MELDWKCALSGNDIPPVFALHTSLKRHSHAPYSEIMLAHHRALLWELEERVEYHSRKAERWATEQVFPIEEFYAIMERGRVQRRFIGRVLAARRSLGRIWHWPLPMRASKLIESFLWGS